MYAPVLSAITSTVISLPPILTVICALAIGESVARPEMVNGMVNCETFTLLVAVVESPLLSVTVSDKYIMELALTSGALKVIFAVSVPSTVISKAYETVQE